MFHLCEKGKNCGGGHKRATNQEIDVIRLRGVGDVRGGIIVAPRGYSSLVSIQPERLSTENSVKHAYVSHRGTQATIFARLRG